VIDAATIEEAERRWAELQGDGSRTIDGSALDVLGIDQDAFHELGVRSTAGLPDPTPYLSGMAFGFVRGVLAARVERADAATSEEGS
jgi:hypothetical protein